MTSNGLAPAGRPGASRALLRCARARGGEAGRQGILDFLADDIAPQIWKLDIRPDDRPVVRIDKRVPQPAQWARTDPVFVAVALPVIVRDVFRAIFDEEDGRDGGWMSDWVRWAGELMPGTIVPGKDDDLAARAEWLDDLLDTFCTRHDVAGPLLTQLAPGAKGGAR